MQKHKLVREILYTKEQIVQRCKHLAKEINQHYKNANTKQPIVVVGILKSCLPFMVELMTNFEFDCEVDFMIISSYCGGVSSSGTLKLILDLNRSVIDRHVLVVEDILESGKTLAFVDNYLKIKGTKEVKKVVLIDRVNRKCNALTSVDWKAFDILNDDFVVGFGFDCKEQLRSLPYVGALDMNKYEKWIKEGSYD